MAYIGKEPQVGNYIKLDAISTSSTNSYSLTKDSVAFTPESALHMLVSLNGVIQSPLSSFSVSGSTITFLPSSGTLSSSDTIDFILVLGNTLDIGTPSDSTVTNAKTNFVSTSSSAGLTIKGDGTSSGTSGTLQLNCSANSHGIKLASPAHSAGQSYTLTFPTTAPVADKALITDGSGNLSFGNAGGLNLLLNATISSAVSEYDISSTYINSTYDSYYVDAYFLPASDGVYLYSRVFVGGAIKTASIYAYETQRVGGTFGGFNSNSNDILAIYNSDLMGNATGEGITINATFQNTNSTTAPFCVSGLSNWFYTDSSPNASTFAGSLKSSDVANVVNGLRFFFNSGNIASGNIKLYGIVK